MTAAFFDVDTLPDTITAAEALLRPQVAGFVGRPLQHLTGLVVLNPDNTVLTATLDDARLTAKALEAAGKGTAAQLAQRPCGMHASNVVYVDSAGKLSNHAMRWRAGGVVYALAGDAS